MIKSMKQDVTCKAKFWMTDTKSSSIVLLSKDQGSKNAGEGKTAGGKNWLLFSLFTWN